MQQTAKGEGKNALAKARALSQFQPRSPKPDEKGKGKGAKKQGKGSSLKEGRPIKVKGKNARTVMSIGGKNYCYFWLTNSCNKGDQCPNIHGCNLLLGENKVCGKNHTPANHQGKFLTA